ncbi:hypothetical protein [Butyrivibrio sp. AE2005]|uniref:hypothetical protein n=1 Tax=Butyrivibrio sp. AE2005 TaxID=1496722 RepID=UPI00068E3A06|nr:hypothetical protein [Butyrivibrio sp. AE2005]
MIRLEKVNGKNVWDLLKLQVSEDQKSFVASNDVSIIEAYTAIIGNGYGKEAVKLALEFIRTYPCGEAEYCWLLYEPENTVASKKTEIRTAKSLLQY